MTDEASKIDVLEDSIVRRGDVYERPIFDLMPDFCESDIAGLLCLCNSSCGLADAYNYRAKVEVIAFFDEDDNMFLVSVDDERWF